MIESELDLHLYYIYSKKKRFWFLHFTPSHLNNKENHNVNNNYENMCSSEKKEEKKKKKKLETKTWVVVREAWVLRGRTATWFEAWVALRLGFGAA